MEVLSPTLSGVKIFRLRAFGDERGFFKESYRQPRYEAAGVTCTFVQDNVSFSQKGVVRGMHFQSEPGQAKLISVLIGTIFDVVVDIRPDSPSFGKWEGFYLEADRRDQLFVPIGFAHGFCVLSEEGALVHYKTSAIYNPVTEKGFRFDDPTIGIEWPLKTLSASPRDQQAPYFKEIFT